MSHQLSLFTVGLRDDERNLCLEIPGIEYVAEFLNPNQQTDLLSRIDSCSWQNDLKRRVQHYGYKYDYKARKIDPSMYVGALPDFAVELAERLHSQGLIPKCPDQLIVNEYEPGQGITPHIDCEPCFGDTICTVSLGSDCEMEFSHTKMGEVRTILLQAGSVLVFSGEARYDWKHCIKARKFDHGMKRTRRVSLTYRNVILD